MFDLTKNYRFKNVPNSEINSIERKGNVLAIEYTRKMIMYIDAEGSSNLNNDYDLVEITPYDGWEKGKRVLATWSTELNGNPDWEVATRRIFSHVDESGRAYIFINGCDEWTSGGLTDVCPFAKPAED